jgi:DNA-binding SARP family transcriptional activator/predicted ATPase
MGEPQIFLGENKLVQFQYRKSVALLAFLAATKKNYNREYLADFLWRNLSEKNAHAGLRKTLSDINKETPNFLTIENHKIALLNSPSIEVDCFSFEQTILALRQKSFEEISNAQIERLEHILPFYQAPFMNGFFIKNAPAFENWVLLQREYYSGLLKEALLKISHFAYHTGQYQKSMEYSRHLLSNEPTQEEAHYNLMSIYALNGQRTLALKQYEICRQALLDTFGSMPNQKIVELYKRIRFQEEDGSVSRMLPLPTMPIYGREEDIHNVLSRLQQKHCRILTLIGPGGIGKTHLALMVGNRINRITADCFEDGVIFISLQALNSIHFLSSSIAHQLGYAYEKESDPVKQLCDFLSPYKMVLILDNFEQLVVSLAEYRNKQYDLINRILQAAPGVKLLITSRIRLNFQGEFVYPLKGISYPEHEENEHYKALNYPAVSLFIQRARQLTGQYTPNERELQSIVHICQSVNGLPLGILLAAGWTNLLTAAEIAETIMDDNGSKRLAFFATGGPDMPERHRDMESVFYQSWSMLSGKQQKTLAALAFLPSSFSIETAKTIAQADLADLKVLLDHSLLERKSSGRLQMHDLLRQYASNRGVDVRGVYERTRDYYSAKVMQWEKDLKSEKQLQAVDEINLEIDNLNVIWEEIISNGDFNYASQMFDGMCIFFSWRHYYAEAAAFCENFVQKLEEKQTITDSFSIQDTYRMLAKALTWQASFLKINEAGTFLSRSMEILDDPILEGCDIRSERAFTCNWMAATLSQTGKFDEAFQLYNQSMTLYEALQDDWRLQHVYLSKGILLWDKSNYSDGKRIIEKSLAISRKIGDRQGIAHALLWLGNVSLFLGDREGEKMVRESLSIFSTIGGESGNDSGILLACSSLFILGMYEEGCDLMRKKYKQNLFEARLDAKNIVYAFCLIHTGNYEEAGIYVEKGVAFARELGEAYGENLALLTQSWYAIYENDFEKAENILKESLLNSEKHDVKEVESLSSSFLAVTWMLMGKKENISLYLRNAVQVAKVSNSITSKVFALGCISFWLCVKGNLELGVAIYAFAYQYPMMSNSVWWEDQVGRKIEALTSDLSEDEIELAKACFADRELDEVISIVLEELIIE